MDTPGITASEAYPSHFMGRFMFYRFSLFPFFPFSLFLFFFFPFLFPFSIPLHLFCIRILCHLETGKRSLRLCGFFEEMDGHES